MMNRGVRKVQTGRGMIVWENEGAGELLSKVNYA